MTSHASATCSIPYEHVGECEVRGTGGWVEWDEVPHDPWNEVARNLWVGSALRAQPTPEDEFDFVLTLWRRALPVVSTPEVLWYFPDSVSPKLDVLKHAAFDLQARTEWGQRCLVRCQLGINRSAYVAAATLVSMGWDPTDAVTRLRAVRGDVALRNTNFVASLLALPEAWSQWD